MVQPSNQKQFGPMADPPLSSDSIYREEPDTASEKKPPNDPAKDAYRIGRQAFASRVLTAALVALWALNLCLVALLIFTGRNAAKNAEQSTIDKSSTGPTATVKKAQSSRGTETTLSANNIQKAFVMARAAQAAQKKNCESEAIQQYLQVLDISPSIASTWESLGKLCLAQQNYPAAWIAFEQAVSANPESVEALNSLAVIYLLNYNRRAALKLFEHAVRLNPEYPRTYFNLALCQLRRDKTKARNAITEYLRLNPNDPRGLRTRAFLDLDDSRHEDALNALTRAMANAPAWSALYFDAARVAAFLDHTREALAYLEKAGILTSPSVVYEVLKEPVFGEIRHSARGRAFATRWAKQLGVDEPSLQGAPTVPEKDPEIITGKVLQVSTENAKLRTSVENRAPAAQAAFTAAFKELSRSTPVSGQLPGYTCPPIASQPFPYDVDARTARLMTERTRTRQTFDQADALMRSGQGTKATHLLREALRRASAESLRVRILSRLTGYYFDQQEYEKAAACTEELEALTAGGDNPAIKCNMAGILMSEGNYEKAFDLLSGIEVSRVKHPHLEWAVDFNMACVHSLRDEAEQALGYLQKAHDVDAIATQTASGDPHLDVIRTDPRFSEITKRLQAVAVSKAISPKPFTADSYPYSMAQESFPAPQDNQAPGREKPEE